MEQTPSSERLTESILLVVAAVTVVVVLSIANLTLGVIALVVGISIVVVYRIVHQPEFGLLLLPVSLTMLPRVPITGDLAVNANMVLIPAMGLGVIRQRGVLVVPRRQLTALGGLLAVVLVGLGRMAFRLSPAEAALHFVYFVHWFLYLVLPVIVWLVVADLPPERRQRVRYLVMIVLGLASTVIVGHLVAVHLDLLPALAGGERIEQFANQDRLRTFWASGPNQVGMFLTVLSLVSVAIALEVRDRAKQVGLIAASVLCVGLLTQTFSRSSFVGLVVGVVLLALVKSRNVLTYASVLTGLGYLVVPSTVRRRYTGGLFHPAYIAPIDRTLPVGPLQKRLSFWLGQLQTLGNRPLFGLGFFATASDNTYVSLYLGTGLLGLALTVYLLTLYARNCVSAYQYAQAVLDPITRGVALGTVAGFGGFLSWTIFGDVYSQWRILGSVFLLVGLTVSILPLSPGTRQGKTPDARADG